MTTPVADSAQAAGTAWRRAFRWDLDKTYLDTHFETVRGLLRSAIQRADQKRAIAGAPALMREIRAAGLHRVCIISGSPRQMRRVLEEKLRLDGVEWDEFELKPNLSNLMRGRFRAHAQPDRLQAAGAARRPHARARRLPGDPLRRRRRGRRLHLFALRRPARRARGRRARWSGSSTPATSTPTSARPRSSWPRSSRPATPCSASSSTWSAARRRPASRPTAAASCPSTTTSRRRWSSSPTASCRR